MTSLADVYRKFGEASEAAQLLETELGNILLQLQAAQAGLLSGDRPEQAAEMLRRINTSTLGQLLKAAGEKDRNLDHAADIMAKALADRNRLAHSFFRQHNFRRNSEEGRALMLADLESIHAALLAAYKAALAQALTLTSSLHSPFQRGI